MSQSQNRLSLTRAAYIKRRSVKRLGSALAAGLLMSFCVCGQDLHVEGEIVYTAFKTNGAALTTMTRRFILDASGGKWLVHSEGLAGAVDPRELWCEDAGDGTNIYQLRMFPPPTNYPASRLAKYVPGLGSIRQETIPVPDTSLAAPVWFAYVKPASSQPPGKFKPLWFDDEEVFYSPKVGYPALVQTNTLAPYLPRKVFFIDSGREVVTLYGKVVSVPNGS